MYHSALRPESEDQAELDYYERGGSVAMRHDILDGIWPVWTQADAVYAEPAWRHGYAVFAQRAGVSAAPYPQYLAAIRTAVVSLAVPTYLLAGTHMLKDLAPDRTQPLRLFGYDCRLAIWKGQVLEGCRTPGQVVGQLATRYHCLLDFCCGYGQTAEAAVAAGKRFICADINAKCVAVVARRFLGWQP